MPTSTPLQKSTLTSSRLGNYNAELNWMHTIRVAVNIAVLFKPMKFCIKFLKKAEPVGGGGGGGQIISYGCRERVENKFLKFFFQNHTSKLTPQPHLSIKQSLKCYMCANHFTSKCIINEGQ